MFIRRIMNQSKERIVICIVLTTILVRFICNYINDLEEASMREQCKTELKTVKYQLNVVTDYKNRLEKLLTESQKEHEADKARFKDFMENCAAMKQQAVFCQSQFEDLQGECKKVRIDYDKVLKELEKLKTSR